ncbi:RNA-directed DNA polymerase (Reverse transcriptase), Ribonuclease H [Gossypium australe]|uniref:RNA-directed DNA polymerase (Reverse transcriptase), Ribonuclease H n=1 Tax=Gossypium australe TaxID=47621 RepID=A0A5B6WMY4_9ROSI|nr:RNA-directed DNA polymerase (Reverse transcriptase), Ribonuclease H [Gossypium australe]
MGPDVLLKIKEEVKKQFDVGFLQVVKYLELIANIVHVPKKDGKVRMCVNYRDLNKASPNDNFPLPHIDTLVDNTTDASSKYEKDHIRNRAGNILPKSGSIRIKNTEATYQKAMVTLFHDMMYKEIEEHVQVLRKLLLRLRKFQLKLNPAKCTSRARSGKLLGFVVSEKEIEIDPDKVKAIRSCLCHALKMRLNYIALFISQLTEKCDPIFCLLKKYNPGVWDEECQKTFDKVKHYLSNAPVLMLPGLDKPLILYLAVFKNFMICVLCQHDESGWKERAIYYLSKKFTKCETRYSPIEKLCCALIWTTRRLRQYMLYHTTWLISKLDPLKYMMELAAYVNQKAIKGSAIADFLASKALEDYEPLNFDFSNEYLMYVATIEEYA